MMINSFYHLEPLKQTNPPHSRQPHTRKKENYFIIF